MGQSSLNLALLQLIYGRSPTQLLLTIMEVAFSWFFSIFLFPFLIKSTTAHTKSATPLMQVGRFGTETNTKTVAGNNLHPKLESSLTAVLKHLSSSALAALHPMAFAQQKICDFSSWNTVTAEHTNTCKAVSPQNTRNMGTLLALCNSWRTHGNTVHIPLPQSRVTHYYALGLYMICISNTQVFSCAFFLSWNQAAQLFPYFVTRFSTGKKHSFFFS